MKKAFGRVGYKVYVWVLIGVLAVTGVNNWQVYYDYVKNNAGNRVRIARYLNSLPSSYYVYLASDAFPWGEHAFRFFKQHLGLTANYSTMATNIQNWFWVCLLAYWQLLLMQPDSGRRQSSLVSAACLPLNSAIDPLESPTGILGLFSEIGNTRQSTESQWKWLGTSKRLSSAPQSPLQNCGEGQKTSKIEGYLALVCFLLEF